MVLRILSLTLLLISSLYAQVNNVGEKILDDYHGPVDPNFIYDPYKNKIQYVDDQLQEDYVSQPISSEVNFLEYFLNSEFQIGAYCPQSFYEKYNHYIRYLYRLQILSYLFQSLREHEYLSKKFQLNTKCSTEWLDFTKACQPKSNEMKQFIKNSQIAFKNLETLRVPFDESRKENYNKWLETLASEDPKGLSQYRLKSHCSNNCHRLSKDKIEKALSNVCLEEKEAFVMICSESDRVYGASDIQEIYHLIVRSSGVRGINDEGFASGCMKRFTEQNKDSEKPIGFLSPIFTVLYDYNNALSPESPQGRLYNIGSIKEFTDKGLADLFKVVKKVEKPRITENKPVVALVNPEFEKIELPKFIKKKIKKTENVKVVMKKPEIKKEVKSSFYLTSEFRERYNLEEIEVDLNKFKYDYVFSLSLIQELSPKIESFSQIKSLKSMKQFDQLGTKKSPIPLRFIKFLIERKEHQSLYNIIQVLGDNFFIFNDIDQDSRKKDLIKLVNSEATKFTWKLYILKSE